jgi:hypothetical protein
MELFRKFRIRIGKSLLSKRLSRIRRKPYYFNFYNIRKIGLVWDASRPEEFIILTRFFQKMSELGKEVKIFGFFPGNGFPDQYTAIRYLTCLKKREVNFFYIPKNPEAESFASTEFDVLIDINFKKHFPLLFVSSLSQAKLKVGLADSKPEQSPFDLMIAVKGPVNIESFLEQVVYYLEMINSESAKKAV